MSLISHSEKNLNTFIVAGKSHHTREKNSEIIFPQATYVCHLQTSEIGLLYRRYPVIFFLISDAF